MAATLSTLRLLSRLPLPLLQSVARGLASTAARFPDKGVAWTVRRNLLIAYPALPDEQLTALTRRCLQSQAMSTLEFVKSWGRPPAFSLGQIGTVHQESIFHQQLTNPKGLIAVVPHFATWEIMNPWINQFAAPVIMYKPGRQPDVDAFVLAARSRLTARLVPTDESGVKAIFRTLKQGGFTIILPDHVPEASGGILAPFFGYDVLTTTLVSRLAQKTGCGVIQMACRRREDAQGRPLGLFDIHVNELGDAIRDRDLLTSVSYLNQQIEQLIAQVPHQYHWAYKRFKDAPGFDAIYQVSEQEARTRLQQLRTSQGVTANQH